MFPAFLTLLFLSRPLILAFLYLLSSAESDLLLILDLLHLLSLYESDSLEDESGDDGSDSEGSGTYYFTLRFDNSVGIVSGLGSGVFVST